MAGDSSHANPSAGEDSPSGSNPATSVSLPAVARETPAQPFSARSSGGPDPRFRWLVPEFQRRVLLPGGVITRLQSIGIYAVQTHFLIESR